MLHVRIFLFLTASWILCSPARSLPADLPTAEPAEVGMDAERLNHIESLVEAGIRDGQMPGCVICIGRQGQIVYLEAFGNRQLQPETESMTTDTVFDMASITKPVATATSILKLVENGKLRLSDKVVDFFPEFAPHGKDEITLLHLLIHQSGLIPDNALRDYREGPQVAWEKICNLDLVAPVGTTFKYSDVNFIVLAELVKKVSGQPIDEFAREQIFEPLGMSESGYRPAEKLRKRAAPTEKRDGEWIRGEVHDPRAYLLDGVAGHAGLFSTAQDLAKYAQAMLDEGTLRLPGAPPARLLSPQTVRVMTSPYAVSSGKRGLGWDKQTGYSSNKGDLLTDAAFGHGGFTGTVLWVDPELDLFFIFLSNRLHPEGKGSVNHLAGKILNVVAASITERRTPQVPYVLCGIDQLVEDDFQALKGKRVGLITNHTGRTRDGRSTAEVLNSSPQVDLVALFSPEHGFEGKLDVSKIGDSQDETTGLKIFSLYGETRRPTPEMLSTVDALVFDIQDIGARFYTYISTMGGAMIAAADADKAFIVLDRPNPINGVDVAGPMLDSGKESFVGFHHLPVRHGMTIGEIAEMLKAELELDLALTVVRCKGWQRDLFWDQTGLMWIDPSPNMRSLTQALLYPGIGLLETTNVSVGRGTDTPFEVLGAPWIDGQQLARSLNECALPGVTFIPIEFIPDSSKHADELCQGINIVITHRARFEPLQTGLAIATKLRELYPEQWNTQSLGRLLGNEQVLQAIRDGKSHEEVTELAREGVREFQRRRTEYLLYE